MADTIKFLDQKGVEYLWKKLSLEDYPNNKTLIAVINAIDKSKVDKVEGKGLSTEDFTTEEKEKLANTLTKEQINILLMNSQADFSIEDENNPSYIKNKPAIATDEDITGFISETGIADPVTASDGSIYTNANGDIYVL